MAKAEPKTEIIEEKPVDAMTVMETVYLPRPTGKEENYVFVGLNGKGYTIMKGMPVKVPKPVADILNESLRNEQKADRWDEEQQAKLGQANRYL